MQRYASFLSDPDPGRSAIGGRLMARWCFALMLVAVVVVRTSAQETPPKTYGSAFLDAYFEPGHGIPDAVKLRFKCQVAENACSPRGSQQVWKIIFMNHFLAGDVSARWREFESNLYSWRFTYPHLIRMSPGQPSARRDIQGESSIFLSRQGTGSRLNN